MIPVGRVFLWTAVIAVVLAMGMGAAVTPVVAQNETDANETATSEEPEYLQPIDTDTRITGWEYTAGRFTLEIEADESTRIAMTEAGTFEEGTTSFNYDEVRVSEGTSTVTFQVADRDGAAVAVSTRQSLEAGTGAIVSTGDIERNPFEHFGGESGLLSGVGLTTVLAFLAGLYVLKTEKSGVIEA